MGCPLYESFDAMVRCDNKMDRQIYGIPYVQLQNGLYMQGVETRSSCDGHSGSGVSEELQEDDDDDEGADGNYSPTAHHKRSYGHAVIKGKPSDASLMFYPCTGTTNRPSSSSSSSSQPSSSGSVAKGKKPSTRGHVSSPPDLTPVTEESTYAMAQSEKNLYQGYPQMTVASDDSYFAPDAPTSSGYP
jgi:hypothetical protein